MFTIDQNEIKSSYDLYELYTDWLVEHFKAKIILSKEEKEMVEFIRENDETIYQYALEQDENEYTLDEFETMIMNKFKDEFI